MPRVSSKQRRKQEQARPKAERERLRELMDVSVQGTRRERPAHNRAMTEAEALAPVLAQRRARHPHLSDKELRSERCSTELGRMYLDGDLGEGDEAERRYQAGDQLYRTTRRYRSMMGLPGWQGDPTPTGEADAEDPDIILAVTRAYNTAWSEVYRSGGQARGRAAQLVCEHVCIRSLGITVSGQTRLLTTALDALADL